MRDCKIRRKSSSRAPPTLRPPVSPNDFPPLFASHQPSRLFEHTHLHQPIDQHRQATARPNHLPNPRQSSLAPTWLSQISPRSSPPWVSARMLPLFRAVSATDIIPQLSRTKAVLPPRHPNNRRVSPRRLPTRLLLLPPRSLPAHLLARFFLNLQAAAVLI